MSNLVATFQHITSGHQPDYQIGIANLGWRAFDVVRFHSTEALSSLFRFRITLARRAQEGPLPLEALLNQPASLAIATEGRWRMVHGIIADAERLEHTSELLLYRIELVPHLFRARLRRRCRTFVDKTLRDILTLVLQNGTHQSPTGAGGLTELTDPPSPPPPVLTFGPYQVPMAHYRWAMSDEERLRDPHLRSYTVQYNETDFDFLSRLLEEEGISYFFEVVAQGVVMTLTDRPGHVPVIAHDERYTLRPHIVGGGGASTREVVQAIGERAGLAPSSVTMRDFSWPRSRITLEAQATGTSPDSGGADHFEYPARDEAVTDDPCVAPAHIVLERFEVERRMAQGHGTVRTMSPGHRFHLDDPTSVTVPQELLTVAVETYGSQHDFPGTRLSTEPFGFPGQPAEPISHHNRFQAIPMEIRFRPARRAPLPRIDGVQTAIVTAEELSGTPPEINADQHARVRVRFPWDQNVPHGVPSSMWIRVSQGWAGGAFGGLYHPRIGHEVIVAYLQGDPERPMVVGRVYNVQTPPPYDASEQPTISTLKSQSSPNAQGSNEFRFEDLAGQEEVYLHAQRDLNESVEHDHSSEIGHNQTNRVHGQQQVQVDGSRSLSVGGNRRSSIGQDDTVIVRRGNREVEVVAGDKTVRVENGKILLTTGPAHIEMEDNRIELNSGQGARIRIGGNVIHMDANQIRLRTPQGASTELNQREVTIGGQNITAFAAEEVTADGSRVVINGEREVDVHGGMIKLNC